MNNAHSAYRVKTLQHAYYQYFEVNLSGESSISQHPINDIDVSTHKRMRIVKDQEQRMAKTNEFNT